MTRNQTTQVVQQVTTATGAGGEQDEDQRSTATSVHASNPSAGVGVTAAIPTTVVMSGQAAAAGGGGGGGSSVSSSTTSSTLRSIIPGIQPFQNLGAGHSASNSSSSPQVIMVDPRAHNKYSQKFNRPVPIPLHKLTEVEIIVLKSMRGVQGSREFMTWQKLATEPIEPKLGVPSHQLGDKNAAEEGDHVRHMYIQQQYVDNLAKIELLKRRIIEYDMIDVANCPVGIRDRFAQCIADLFTFEEAHILTSWDTIDYDTACTYQWAINTAGSDEDQMSNKWLKILLLDSCTTALRDIVMLKYNDLKLCHRGAVTFAWILCNTLFSLNREMVAALVQFLKSFREKGLRRYQGENMVQAHNELLAVCSRLSEAKELPQETPEDILTGLTLCSVDSFKSLFEHKLQASKVQSLEGKSHYSQSELLGQIRVLLSKALQYYSNLNMSDGWSLPDPKKHRANVFGTPPQTTNFCWNCGKPGHGLDQCRDPRNEEKIAEHRRKWMESNGKSSKKKKGKGNTGAGGGNYTRDKWSPPKPGESGVRHIDGIYHAYCKKKKNGIECGWNTSHSTSYHVQWAAGGSAFSLEQACPTHELVLKTRSALSSGSRSASSGGSSGGSSGNTASMNAVILPESIKRDILTLGDSVRTPYTG